MRQLLFLFLLIVWQILASPEEPVAGVPICCDETGDRCTQCQPNQPATQFIPAYDAEAIAEERGQLFREQFSRTFGFTLSDQISLKGYVKIVWLLVVLCAVFWTYCVSPNPKPHEPPVTRGRSPVRGRVSTRSVTTRRIAPQ